MSFRQKTLQELEKEYADVMNEEAVTRITRRTPKNSTSEVSEEELERRIKRFAPESREIMRKLDEGDFFC
jgi:transcription initiation factor IIE alpha subunit